MKTKKTILSLGFAAALIGSLAFTAPEAKAGDDEAAIIAGAILGGILGYVLHEANEDHHTTVHATVGYPAPVVVHQPVVYQPQPVVVYQPQPVVVYQPQPVVVYQPRPVIVHQPVVVKPAPTCTKVVVVASKPNYDKHDSPKWSYKDNDKHGKPSWSYKDDDKHGKPDWSNKGNGKGNSTNHGKAPAKGNEHSNRARW